MRLQIGIEEREVGELVVGVVVDVLGHVRVQHRQCRGIGRVAAPAGNFVVLNAAKFVVLLPDVGFERLERGQETQNCRVSRRETAAGDGLWRFRQEPSCPHGRCPGRRSFDQEGTTIAPMLGLFGCFHGLLLREAPCLPEGGCARQGSITRSGGARGSGRAGWAKESSPAGIALGLTPSASVRIPRALGSRQAGTGRSRRTLRAVATCVSCGSENPSAAKFCSECGAPLASNVRPVEERKVVSVVFCDLVGSTARAERMDPEDVRAELSSYHARVRSELERRGGTLEKFIGDAVVAVFGAPRVHEDDAERAVRAALAIRDWAADEEEIDVRLAVNTGEALVSVDARASAGEGHVAGDVINTAARLQTAAPVNGILVGERTFRATEQRIEYRSRGDVAAKGKQEPVAAWEVIAARSLFGVDVDLKPATGLVGRRRELDQLLDALDRARAEHEPQLVTIVGVPGMGKSRLVQELSARIEAEPELTRWRQGRSLPYGEGVSYWALGEMVKAEAGILESDTASVAEAKLSETVARVCGEQEVEWLRTMLQPLVGVADDAVGGDRRADAFAAWRRFMDGLAAERATVLVFEDLHWADDGLLDFVDSLVDWATDVPLLVVATARPELLGRRPHWGGGKTNAATLSLAPLTEKETAELVHAILERSVLPADVQVAVLARAGGNPLYAEEFARMVEERGDLSEDGDLDLPDSVQGLIAARLDSLTRAEKELLQDAAVVGKVFWPGALGAHRDAAALDDALRALERKEFVRRERRSSVEGDLQYAFRHVLVRDVAYGQIPRATRAERHREVAEWIERRVRSEDAAELLAHHYSSALDYARAAGRDETGLARRACVALRDAGRRAVALNTFTSAARFFEAAVDLMPEDNPDWPRLVLEHAEAAVYVDLSSDRRLIEARGALVAADDAARAETLLGEYRWLRGDQIGADEHFRIAEGLADRMTDENAKLRVLAELARFAMLADQNQRAVTIGRPALVLAEKLGRDEMRAHVLNTIGVARTAQGEKGGLADLEASCEIARGGGGPQYVRACGNLASVLTTYGQLRRAAELHEEALGIANEVGYDEPTRWLATEIALDHLLAGRWAQSRQLADEIIRGFEVSPFWIQPQTRICRARMLIAEGAAADAVRDAERAVELVQGSNVFQSVCGPLAFRARLHAELGENEDAARVVAGLLDTWVESRSGYVEIWILDAWLAASMTGNEQLLRTALDSSVLDLPWLDAATLLMQRQIDEAARALEEIGAVSIAAEARLWGGEWLVEQGRHSEASVQLERSRSFWRSVGARAYLKRSEALLAAAS
jgi:class 3 adenylate cyclase/tetratricopeptide (TPR) repeat protein